MTPEVAVLNRLLDIDAVTAIVGARVYQLRFPQRPTFPAIRVQLIDDVPAYHLRGENGLIPSRVQVDDVAEEGDGTNPYAQASALASAIAGSWLPGSPGPPTGLSGWRGDLGGSPPTIRVEFIRRIDRSVLYDPGELRQVRIRQDFLVWWKPL
jgi:uncharacterized protein DUF3168